MIGARRVRAAALFTRISTALFFFRIGESFVSSCSASDISTSTMEVFSPNSSLRVLSGSNDWSTRIRCAPAV